MGEKSVILSLTMIVKNEEKYLEECLESVKDVADEIILVDTGSTDKTVQIASKFNAKIYFFEWIKDFSAARNFALSKAEGRWILYLDADERIDSSSIKEIQKIKKTGGKEGFFCTVKSIDNENNRDNSMKYVRLFSNIGGIAFSGAVHEQISPSLIEKGVVLRNSSIIITHLGYNIPEEAKREKAERNLSLLKSEFEAGHQGYIAYQLANTYSILDDTENAEKYYKIASESENLSKFLKADSFTNLALIAHKSYNSAEANAYLEKSLKLNEEQPFAYLLKSKIKLQEGDKTGSSGFCRKAYQLNKKAMNSSLKNDLFIFLNDEEVIGFGLYLALFSGDRENLQFYLSEYSRFLKEKRGDLAVDIVTLVTKLLTSASLTENEEKGIAGILNQNTSGFLYLLLENSSKVLSPGFVEKIYKEKRKDLGAIKLLSKYYIEIGAIDRGIAILEENNDLIENDPGAVLLLVSNYILIDNRSKAGEWLNHLEDQFGNIPQIKSVVDKIKEKIK